ncbi:MAG TPA: thioesterase family protein [Candidatus Dormibacteraeota bacterium]|jgi:4-hydroxybenzoyl-CoA thioesterase|nr:thioesterase family protein [Candidatus Dormibacteraeota bacterium]
MLKNRKQIHVEWGDCDPAGIVYYPRFFEMFDSCTNALFEKAGFPKQEMLAKYGLAGVLMVETSAKFFVPSSFGDTVTVESRILEWGNSSFRVEHKLFRGDVLAAEGLEKRVWTVRDKKDSKRLKSERIPQEVKDKFQ